eukprot:6456153-Amphidinium_carterae.2
MPSGQKLLVAADYGHLGRMHTQSGSLKKEIRTRLAKACGAFKTYSKVLTSPSIAVRARLELFRTYVVCHVVQHASTTPKLTDVDYHCLRTCYMQLLRKTLRECSNSHRVSSMSDAALCAMYKAPTFLTVWDQRRLVALPKLITIDCPPLRCLLASCWATASIWSGLFSSLARLQASTTSMQGLPAPSRESFSHWCEHILAHHSEWRGIVKTYTSVDPPRIVLREATSRSTAARVQEEHLEVHPEAAAAMAAPSEVADVQGTLGLDASASSQFSCCFPGCKFVAKNAAGLAMHGRRKHDIQSPLSLRVDGNICPSCQLPFDTRDRVLDHLKNCKRCNKYVMANVTPMTNAALRLVLDKERGANYAWSRAVTPKPGPKPPGERPPRHSVEAIFVNDEYKAAATTLD